MDQLLLVLLPGAAMFVAGLIYGLVYVAREQRVSVRAAQLRLVGLALIVGLPALYLTSLIVSGRAPLVTLIAVVGLITIAFFYLYLARGLRVPPNES